MNLTESAVLTCSHSDQGFERILWYKRSDDKGFIFLGYLNNNFPNPEDEFKHKLIGNTCLYIHFCNTVIMYVAARFAAVSK